MTTLRLVLAVFALTAAIGTLALDAPDRRVSAATPVTVQLTIQQVIVDGCFEGSDPIFNECLGDPDFYARARINNGPLNSSDTRGDDTDPAPNWQFTANVDWGTTPTVPIHIELWDEDDTLRLGDDRADISPVDGATDLDLTLRLDRVPCTFDGSNINPTGTCGIENTVVGFGDDGEAEARIIFRIDIINIPDADGDGIANDWEQFGVNINGQFIDLPAMGADPNKPDIFIHIDWMAAPPPSPGSTPPSQALSSAAIQQVVNAFANSPYRSPTGSTGINLHVDQGPNSIRDFSTNATWGALSRAREISRQTNLGALINLPQLGIVDQYDWTQFQTIKDANFTPTGRGPIFHYAIAAVFLQPPNAGAAQDTSSGISRNNGAQFANGASDFIISLGGFGCPTLATCGVGTSQQQAGTLMHELGHNLGLQHGGGDSSNFKPNYISIMNYLFQMRGLDVGASAGVVDYSRTALSPLNENQLNEANALGVAGFGTGSRCPAPSASPPFTRQYISNANGPFDWNCDGDTADGVVSFDANGSGGIDTNLMGFDDWSNLRFRGGQIGQLGAAIQPLFSPREPEIPSDDEPPTTTVQVIPAPNANDWNKAAVTVNLHATDNPGGVGVRDITYSATGAQPIASTTVTGDTASFTVSAEGTTTITFAARDHDLNVEVAKQLVVRVDLTDPTVALGTAFPPPNAAGWNNTDVSVPFTSTDTP